MKKRTARILKSVIEMIEQEAYGFAICLIQELLDYGEMEVVGTKEIEKALDRKILPDDSFDEYIPGEML